MTFAGARSSWNKGSRVSQKSKAGLVWHKNEVPDIHTVDLLQSNHYEQIDQQYKVDDINMHHIAALLISLTTVLLVSTGVQAGGCPGASTTPSNKGFATFWDVEPTWMISEFGEEADVSLLLRLVCPVLNWGFCTTYWSFSPR